MVSRRSFTTTIVTVLVLGAGAVALEWGGAQHNLVSAKSDSQTNAGAASPTPQATAPIDLTINGHHIDVLQNGTTQVTNPDGSQTTVTSLETSSSPQPSSQPLNVSVSSSQTGSGNSESFSSVTQTSTSFSDSNNIVTNSSNGETNVNVTTP